jgi:Zn finger protein HypA/HybF involved in hydrogenase expression
MAQKRRFECLRCEQRFPMDYDPKKVVERTCPRCGSNSVRLEPAGQGPSAETE